MNEFEKYCILFLLSLPATELQAMSTLVEKMFNKRNVNGWRLFTALASLVSLFILLRMAQVDKWDGESVSALIQYSVRWSVPLLYLAFAASSLHVVHPFFFSRWLMRNRKFIGLGFSFAMAWQLFFILWLVTVFKDYYVEEVYVLRDAIEGVVGYLFLFIMTVTSFSFSRRRLPPGLWALLHKAGIYFLWAYAFSVYWWALFYYPDPDYVDYIYFVTGFAAWGLRAMAWRHRRAIQSHGRTVTPAYSMPHLYLGYVLVGFGVLVACLSGLWRESAETIFTGHSFTHIPDNYLPYWPFEPFYSMFIILLGIGLTLERQQGTSDQQ